MVRRRFLVTAEVFDFASKALSTMSTFAPREMVGFVRYALKFTFEVISCRDGGKRFTANVGETRTEDEKHHTKKEG